MLTTPELSAQLARAYALLNEGKLSQAEGVCRTVLASESRNAAATHLLGLIRARAGDLQAGEQLMRRSIELEPRDARLRLSIANFLRRNGALPEAEREYRTALQLAPSDGASRHGLALTLDALGKSAAAESEARALLAMNQQDPESWSLLGFLLNNQDRLSEAEAAYRQALALNPRYGLAHHNLGSLLARLDRAEEALAALEQAQASGAQGFELAFSRGRALSLLYRTHEAEGAFAEAVSLRPRHVEAQLNLARLRYMHGDPEFARGLAAALAQAPQDSALHSALASVRLRAGQVEAAEQQLRQALERGPEPQLRFVLSQVLREAERLPEAELEATEAAAALPGDSAVVENLVSILLSRARADQAMSFIRVQRARKPDAQAWLAYEATAARLLGAPAYQELFDYRRFVRTYELQPPPGFASVAELNAALIEALAARHRFSTHPLDQSLAPRQSDHA